MCDKWIVSLEKSLPDLAPFKELAKNSGSALDRVGGLTKRKRETSSDIGVSPDKARERPSAKLTRKRLDFNVNQYYNDP